MKTKKALSGLVKQLQDASGFDVPQAETLVQQQAPSNIPEASPKKTASERPWPLWPLALVPLLLIPIATPLLLFLSVATVAVPLLVLLAIVGLACWKVSDWTYGRRNKSLGDPQ